MPPTMWCLRPVISGRRIPANTDKLTHRVRRGLSEVKIQTVPKPFRPGKKVRIPRGTPAAEPAIQLPNDGEVGQFGSRASRSHSVHLSTSWTLPCILRLSKATHPLPLSEVAGSLLQEDLFDPAELAEAAFPWLRHSKSSKSACRHISCRGSCRDARDRL